MGKPEAGWGWGADAAGYGDSGGGYSETGGEGGGGYQTSKQKKRAEAFQKWLAEEIKRQQLLAMKKSPEFKIAETRREEKKKLKRRLGRSTILTTPLGLIGEAPTRRPTLLGG